MRRAFYASVAAAMAIAGAGASAASAATTAPAGPPASLVRMVKAHAPKIGEKIPPALMREAKAARRHRHGGSLLIRPASITSWSGGAYCFEYGFPSQTLITTPTFSASGSQWFYDRNVGVGSNGTISSYTGVFWWNPIYASSGWYYNGAWGSNGVSVHPDLVYGFNYFGSNDGQYAAEFYNDAPVQCQ